MIGIGISPFIKRYGGGTGLLAPIFIMIAGQSNARGQGTPFPAEYQGDILNGEIWNGTAFETLNGSVDNNNQLGQPQGTFGTEMSLIKDLLTRHSAVYCMKYAMGSSYLASVAQGGGASNWHPDTVGGLYDNLVSYTNLAIAALPANCTTGGLYWYQGCADSTTSALAILYPANISYFISSFKTDTNQPDLKVFLTRILNIGDNGLALFSPRVRAALQIEAHDNYGDTYCVSVDDLGIEADFTHLTAQGYVDLGLRYSSALATPPIDLTTLYSTDFPGTTLETDSWQTNGTAPVISANKLTLVNNHAGTVTFESGRNCLSRYVISSGDIYARCKMSWTDPVQNSQSLTGFLMHKDSNNYIAVFTDTTIAGGNGLKIRKRLASVNTDTAISAVNGDEFKMSYNCTTGAYSVHYWTAGAWSLLSSGTAFTGATKPLFTSSDSATFLGGDSSIFEEFDFTITDFTTRRP